MRTIFALCALVLCTAVGLPQQLAFPGAEGPGRFASGGRGGEVYFVTRDDDTGPSGSYGGQFDIWDTGVRTTSSPYLSGDLRNAICSRTPGVPRTVIFRLPPSSDGYIKMRAPLFVRYSHNLRLSGQTRPGGVCVRNFGWVVYNSTNWIMEHIRFRRGDTPEAHPGPDGILGTADDIFYDDDTDAFKFGWIGNDYPMSAAEPGTIGTIVKNCTFSWGRDEIFDWTQSTNYTAMYTLCYENFDASHNFGGFVNGWNGSYNHCAWVLLNNRPPLLQVNPLVGGRLQFVNNLSYLHGYGEISGGWSQTNRIDDQFQLETYYDLIGCYRRWGPSSVQESFVATTHSTYTGDDAWYYRGPKIYMWDNMADGAGYSWVRRSDQWENTGGVNRGFVSYCWSIRPGVPGYTGTIDTMKLTSPVIPLPSNVDLPPQGYTNVLTYAGAWRFNQNSTNGILTPMVTLRDSADEGAITAVRNRTRRSGLSSAPLTVADAGGWPTLSSTDPLLDSDNDGMPDVWEDYMGLNKNDSTDRNGDKDGDGYTNLEEYLNGESPGAPITPGPGRTTGSGGTFNGVKF